MNWMAESCYFTAAPPEWQVRTTDMSAALLCLRACVRRSVKRVLQQQVSVFSNHVTASAPTLKHFPSFYIRFFRRLQDEIAHVAAKAFLAVQGTGYGGSNKTNKLW